MKFRAEDFTMMGSRMSGDQLRAETAVRGMNQGVDQRNYGRYQEGVRSLMKEMEKDMPQWKKPMKRKLFLLDTVARFIEEAQANEIGYREFPFETKIGIGELFMNPTLEVRVRETQEQVAVFESVDGFRLVKSNRRLENIQDDFIQRQERRLHLNQQIQLGEELLENPQLIQNDAYSVYRIPTEPATETGVAGLLTNYIARKQPTYSFLAPVVKRNVKMMKEEVKELERYLSRYVDKTNALDKEGEEAEHYREAFRRLMKQYQVREAKTYSMNK